MPVVYPQYICPPFLSLFLMAHLFLPVFLTLLPPPSTTSSPAATLASSSTILACSSVPLIASPLWGIPLGSV